MFRLNQSLVEQMNSNKSVVVITHKDFLAANTYDIKDKEHSLENNDKALNENAEAKRIIEEAKKRAEQIRKEAWQDGYKDGQEAGRKEAAEMVQEQVSEARSIFAKLARYKEELYRELQNSLIELSLDIAEKIVNKELEKDDTLYVGIVKKAISSLKGTDKFTLRVGRKEYDRFFRDGLQWLLGDADSSDIEVVCDAQMGEGGCILESAEENINASVKLQMERIRHVLEDGAERHE